MRRYPVRRILAAVAAVAFLGTVDGCVRPVMLSGSGSLEMTLPLGTELVYVREAAAAGWSPGDTLVHRIVEFVPGGGRELRLDRVWLEPYVRQAEEPPEAGERPLSGSGRTRADGPIIHIEARMGRLAPRAVYRANTSAGMVRLDGPGDRTGDLLAPAPGTGVRSWGSGRRKMQLAVPDTLIETPAGDFRCVEVFYEDPEGQRIRSWWADGVGWVGTQAVAYRPEGNDPYAPWFLTGESWTLVAIRKPR